jgi:hypothetical protein
MTSCWKELSAYLMQFFDQISMMLIPAAFEAQFQIVRWIILLNAGSCCKRRRCWQIQEGCRTSSGTGIISCMMKMMMMTICCYIEL